MLLHLSHSKHVFPIFHNSDIKEWTIIYRRGLFLDRQYTQYSEKNKCIHSNKCIIYGFYLSSFYNFNKKICHILTKSLQIPWKKHCSLKNQTIQARKVMMSV